MADAAPVPPGGDDLDREVDAMIGASIARTQAALVAGVPDELRLSVATGALAAVWGALVAAIGPADRAELEGVFRDTVADTVALLDATRPH